MATALAEHAMENSHRIAWEESEVLDSNPYPHQHCAIEAWHIRSQPLPMNRETGLLPTAYNRLINNLKPSTPPELTCFHVGTLVLKYCCL